MADKQNICVVTSTRAEYGLLYWLMKRIEASAKLDLKLAVTGTHLARNYGSTHTFIIKDGFKIHAKINVLSSREGSVGIGETAANVIKKFTAYFSETKPAAVILLGDRYEILATAQAAVISGIPVIHLHGGEITEGANDDMFRHAITKLSSFHFTSNDQHRRRVIQLGEQPSVVKISGALGIENIKKLDLLDKITLEERYKITFQKRIFLITFHPATLEKESPEKQFEKMLKAVLTFKNTTFVISKANADLGGAKINALIDKLSTSNKNVLASHSFGQINYLSLMRIADVVIGNSSSGILEAPSLFVPTVDIGSRQKGRLSAKSVIHCGVSVKDICGAIEKAMKMKGRKIFNNPYDRGSASEKIATELEKIEFRKLLPKKFHDLP